MSTTQTVWFRCLTQGNTWRPAFIRDGITYVSPSVGQSWRPATEAERATLQLRIPQNTVGRIFDDALYVTS